MTAGSMSAAPATNDPTEDALDAVRDILCDPKVSGETWPYVRRTAPVRALLAALTLTGVERLAAIEAAPLAVDVPVYEEDGQ